MLLRLRVAARALASCPKPLRPYRLSRFRADAWRIGARSRGTGSGIVPRGGAQSSLAARGQFPGHSSL